MIKPFSQGFLALSSPPIQYLSQNQLNNLTRVFQNWFDESPTPKRREIHGRYWLTFLVLRHTGARLGEALAINDNVDIDFRNSELKLVTLKRHRPGDHSRIVPVPSNVIAEIATYLAEFPGQKGKVFGLDQGNFRRVFYARAAESAIPKKLAHPHILRHSYAIELLRAGVPVTIVKDLLGHSNLNTTAIYLHLSGQEAKAILREKGII